jgi:hypothetical protein
VRVYTFHFLDGVLDKLGHNTFLPLGSKDVSLSEKFSHSHSFGVKRPNFNRLVERVVTMAILIKLLKRLTKIS